MRARPCCCYCCCYRHFVHLQINDRYEFYDTIDLDRGDGQYLSSAADRNLHNTYKLLAVLVHSGGVHGGHYYAYVRCGGAGPAAAHGSTGRKRVAVASESR